MTIEDFEQIIIPQIEKIDGVEFARLNDYNSESLELYIDTENKANLKKVTPAIKKVFKDNHITEGLVEQWTAPTAKDEWGNRDDSSYHIDINYDGIAAGISSELEGKEIIAFSKKYPNLPYGNEDLGRLFVSTYDLGFDGPEDHTKYIQEKYLNNEYDVYPLWIYSHGGEVFELSPSCKWDSGLTGMIAVKKDSETTIEQVMEELEDWMNPGEEIESLLGQDDDIEESQGIRSTL